MIIAGTLVTGELGPVVTLLHEEDNRFSTESIDFQSDEGARSYWDLNFHDKVSFHDEGAIYVGSRPTAVGMDVSDGSGVLKIDFDNGEDHVAMAVVASSEFVMRVGWPLLQGIVVSNAILANGVDVARPPTSTDLEKIHQLVCQCLTACSMM